MPLSTSLVASTRTKKPVLIAAAALIVAAVLAFVLTRAGGSNSDKIKTSGGRTSNGVSSNGSEASAGAAASGPGVGPGAGAADSGLHVTLRPVDRAGATPNMPLDVSVSNTKDLRDGDPVSIHVTAKPGSQIFGFEAFQCVAGTTYAVDSDIRPTRLGKCALQPLSAASQRYLLVQTQAPYKEADGTFKVGVGSNPFKTDDGRQVTVTCDASHPCTLVLKLQYPNGFGFDSIPLTFR